MKNKQIKLYNIIFPIWMLWLFPLSWIIVLPANFIIDLLVLCLTMKFLKIDNIKVRAKKLILKVWLFGFAADFIGTFCMFASNLIDFDYQTNLGKWWYKNITNSVSYNPFESIYGFLWVLVCLLITGFFIYLFNYKISFKNSELDKSQKHKLALSMAVFTTPYLFLLPTSLFF